MGELTLLKAVVGATNWMACELHYGQYLFLELEVERVPALAGSFRLGVDTPVVGGSASSSDADSIDLCTFAGCARDNLVVALGPSLSHGSVLAMLDWG